MTAIDWSTLMANSAGSFDPVPNGDYEIVVTEAEATQSQNNKDMIKAKFRIEGGPHDGRTLWNQFVVSPENPNALSFFFQHMKVFGMDQAFFAQQPSMGQIAQNMVGKRAKVTTSIRTWNGQERNEIKAIKPSLGGVGGPQGGPVAGPAGVPAAAPVAAPVTTSAAPAAAPAPTAPPVAAPVVAPAPAAPAPAAPVPPQVAAPPAAGVAPVPVPVTEPVAAPPAAAPAAAAAPVLPPGMDQAQYEAFLAFQQSQAAAAPAAPAAEAPVAPAPTAAPQPEAPAPPSF